MESSKVFGGSAEECHSSESGWTMYIGSPIHGDDDDEHSDDFGDYVDNDDDGGSDDTDANHDDDSDDSMASDASSGPSYLEARHRMAHFKHNEKEEDDGKCTGSEKKAKRQMEKQKAQLRRHEEKEETMFDAKRASAPSDSKVRTNVWIGKRK